MLVKDLLRELTKIKKKHPEAKTYIFGDGLNNLESISRIVQCYAPLDLVQNDTVTSESCIKDFQEGYSPVIVIG